MQFYDRSGSYTGIRGTLPGGIFAPPLLFNQDDQSTMSTNQMHSSRHQNSPAVEFGVLMPSNNTQDVDQGRDCTTSSYDDVVPSRPVPLSELSLRVGSRNKGLKNWKPLSLYDNETGTDFTSTSPETAKPLVSSDMVARPKILTRQGLIDPSENSINEEYQTLLRQSMQNINSSRAGAPRVNNWPTDMHNIQVQHQNPLNYYSTSDAFYNNTQPRSLDGSDSAALHSFFNGQAPARVYAGRQHLRANHYNPGTTTVYHSNSLGPYDSRYYGTPRDTRVVQPHSLPQHRAYTGFQGQAPFLTQPTPYRRNMQITSHSPGDRVSHTPSNSSESSATQAEESRKREMRQAMKDAVLAKIEADEAEFRRQTEHEMRHKQVNSEQQRIEQAHRQEVALSSLMQASPSSIAATCGSSADSGSRISGYQGQDRREISMSSLQQRSPSSVSATCGSSADSESRISGFGFPDHAKITNEQMRDADTVRLQNHEQYREYFKRREQQKYKQQIMANTIVENEPSQDVHNAHSPMASHMSSFHDGQTSNISASFPWPPIEVTKSTNDDKLSGQQKHEQQLYNLALQQHVDATAARILPQFGILPQFQTTPAFRTVDPGPVPKMQTPSSPPGLPPTTKTKREELAKRLEEAARMEISGDPETTNAQREELIKSLGLRDAAMPKPKPKSTPMEKSEKSARQDQLKDANDWFHFDGRGERKFRQRVAKMADECAEERKVLEMGSNYYSNTGYPNTSTAAGGGGGAAAGDDAGAGNRETTRQMTLLVGDVVANMKSYVDEIDSGKSSYFGF